MFSVHDVKKKKTKQNPMVLPDFIAKPGKLSFRIMGFKVDISNAQTKTWEALACTPDYIYEILQPLGHMQTT